MLKRMIYIRWKGEAISVALLSLLLVTIIFCVPATALTVSGSKLMSDVAPGATITHKMIVSINSDDAPLNVSVKVLGMSQDGDFIYNGVNPAQDVSPFSARTFILVDKNSVHLEPGSSETITATIKIPTNVGQGGRYAIISLQGGAQGTQAGGFATAVNVPIMLTIKGGGLKETGRITEVSVGEIFAGEPIVIATDFTNTGNHHYYNAFCEVMLYDAGGNVVLQDATPPSVFAIIPAQWVTFKSSIDEALPIGKYTVVSRIRLGSTTIFDTKNVTFEIMKAYEPPFKEVKGSVNPQTTATITTPDGKVSVMFPQGAVLDSTMVAIKPSSMRTLSAAPAGTRFASTALSIEGISGLLSKPATITLKYSPDDLTEANGDATKLFLARWDKAEGKWTLIPTKVDTTAGILTVTTTRLSTWAVMVSEGVMPTETVVEGTRTPGFTIGIAIGALALLLILKRSRHR
jgi:hypothetical protein